MTKFLLLKNVTRDFEGRRLYRIFRLKDQKLGGWIEKEANLSQRGTCFVYDNGTVFGNAVITGSAQVRDNGIVCDDAIVSGSARVYGSARVHGHARLSGTAHIYDQAQALGRSRVDGSVRLGGSALITGRAHLEREECFDKFEIIGREDEAEPPLQLDSPRPSGIPRGLYRQLPVEEYHHPWPVPVHPPSVAKPLPVPEPPADVPSALGPVSEPAIKAAPRPAHPTRMIERDRSEWRLVGIAALVGASFIILVNVWIKYSHIGGRNVEVHGQE